MDRSSTKISLSSHPALKKRVIYPQTVLLFTKNSLDTEKPILVVNIPPLKFTGGTTNQVITVNIQVAWYPDI